MLEYVVTVGMTVAAMVIGFVLGRTPVDTTLKLPKIKRTPKPKPLTVSNRQGQRIKVEKEEESPYPKEPGA